MAVVAITASGEYELAKFASAADARAKLAEQAGQVRSLTGSAVRQPPPELWVETRNRSNESRSPARPQSNEMIRYSDIEDIVDR